MDSPLKKKNSSAIHWAVFAALLFLSCLLMAVYAMEGEEGPLHGIQRTTSLVSAPVQTVGTALDSGVSSVTEGAADVVADEDSLSALRETNAQLRLLLAQADEYKKQAEELQALLNLKDAYAAQGVAARIIGKSGSAWDQTITIDKGSDEGVETGLSVMGPYGLIGQVISVTPKTAVVRLLSDSRSGAAALIQSSRVEGIVKGSLEGLLYLENVDEDAQLSVGDVVVTSGLGGSYVKGLLIGTVVNIDEEQGSSSRLIVVAPNDAASSLETVLVVFGIGSASSGDAEKPSGDAEREASASLDASDQEAQDDDTSLQANG